MDFIVNIDKAVGQFIQDYLSNGFLDKLFLFITELGDIYFFIILAVAMYWIYNKRFAYKFFFAFVGSALVNTIAKVSVKRNRPYDLNEDNMIFSVGKESTGYSFPSGHSQATGVIFHSMNKEFGINKIVKGLLIAHLVLVPFSRLYLGQHYLSDVIVGVLIGIIMSIVMFKLFDLMKDKEHIYPLYAIPVIIVLLIVFNNKDYGAFKDMFVAAGGYIGFTIGYAIEKLYIKHNVNTSVKNKIIKMVIGLIGVAIVYLGLSSLFDKIDEASLILDAIRYSLVAIFAAAGAPYLFTKLFKDGKELVQE